MDPLKALSTARWLMVIPAAPIGWYAAVFVTLLLHGLATALCPADQLISGLCVAAWFEGVEQAIIALGAALAALLVVLLPSWTAPRHRRTVATVAFLLGACTGLWMATQNGAWLVLAAAVITGLVTLGRVYHSSHADQRTHPE